MNDELPDGWTIERVRAESGDSEAALASLERLVVFENIQLPDYLPVRPDTILSFHDLCLVREDEDWYMGQFTSDGSVVCWADYGPDLGAAIRGL